MRKQLTSNRIDAVHNNECRCVKLAGTEFSNGTLATHTVLQIHIRVVKYFYNAHYFKKVNINNADHRTGKLIKLLLFEYFHADAGHDYFVYTAADDVINDGCCGATPLGDNGGSTSQMPPTAATSSTEVLPIDGGDPHTNCRNGIRFSEPVTIQRQSAFQPKVNVMTRVVVTRVFGCVMTVLSQLLILTVRYCTFF
jgi:hypothetical protein